MHGEFTGNNLQVQLLHVGLIDPFPSLSKVISLKKKKNNNNCFHLQLLTPTGDNPAVAL